MNSMNIKKIVLFLCLSIAYLFCSHSELRAAPRGKLKAASVIVMNAESGKILFAKDPDKPMQPASLTKILTLYLVHEAIKEGKIKPSDRVKISLDAQLTGGSSMYIVDDTEVVLDDLIKGVAVMSANDASVAVAEHVGGSVEKFVAMMNAKAQEIGMTHSHFVNPNGLPANGQVSTARDILSLSHSYIRKFPEALQLHSLQEYTYKGINQKNGNDLLKRTSGVDGLKTGFVSAAGYHLVATAKRGNTRIIVVVMGEKNPKIRAQETARLMERGFSIAKKKGKRSAFRKKISP
jgi:D-alanyl-D-alanine carboxypeptidase (penicillin-binding protein 5/6)